MLTELVKHKHLGDIDGILFVLKDVISERPRSVADIRKYCSTKSVDLIYTIDGILAILEFAGLVSRSRNSIKLDKRFSSDWWQTANTFNITRTITEGLFMRIKDESFLDDFISLDKIRFDTNLNQISIHNNSIPLQYSPIKKLLINLGAFRIHPNLSNVLLIDGSLQEYFENLVVPWLIDERERLAFSEGKAKLSIEKLLELQELKNLYGIQAEEFVLEYEKSRLAGHPLHGLIRRISNVDVSAGYDIVSFESLDSRSFDRFIEVKSLSKYPEFYWSRNEVRTAELKRSGYFLYLVDRDQVGTEDYHPTIIVDPFASVFQSDRWHKEPYSWVVKQNHDYRADALHNTKVFMSYSHSDKTFARKLAEELERHEYIVWWDYSTLKGGQDWQREIQRGITECQYFLVVLTPEAVTSEWVGNEITLATQKNKMVIPLYLQQCEIPLAIIKKQYIEFERQTHKAAIKELIELLRILDQNLYTT